jgi:hypothetical protein
MPPFVERSSSDYLGPIFVEFIDNLKIFLPALFGQTAQPVLYFPPTKGAPKARLLGRLPRVYPFGVGEPPKHGFWAPHILEGWEGREGYEGKVKDCWLLKQYWLLKSTGCWHPLLLSGRVEVGKGGDPAILFAPDGL